MTFDELNKEIFDLIDRALEANTSYAGVLGALSAQVERIKIMWALDVNLNYERRQQQSPQEAS